MSNRSASEVKPLLLSAARMYGLVLVQVPLYILRARIPYYSVTIPLVAALATYVRAPDSGYPLGLGSLVGVPSRMGSVGHSNRAPRWRSPAGPPSRTIRQCLSASSAPAGTGVSASAQDGMRWAVPGL